MCSFDGAFQVHSVEPGQDCKRALFIGQGDCTYMRAEDIEGSNLLDSHGSAGTASHVLCSLNKEHRLVLSLHVLASMKTASKGKWWQKSLREWELEVRSYKSSSLFVNEEPERVVFLSAIEIQCW